MDQRKERESRQEVLDFKCKKIIHCAEKSTAQPTAPLLKTATVGQQNPGNEITLQTPDKTNELSQKEREAQLPEKYKLIAEFFDRMSCSIRLLGLRKKLPTFQNICHQVEVLTKRKLSYRHLAQMKYLLPEAMQIDKILVHDEKTLCMKPDMKITLLFDVVEGHDEQTDFMALHKAFASRLMKFFANHPKGCDIPEALLPEPFCQQTQITIPEVSPVDSTTECHPMKNGPLSEPSHLCPSFSRHFSREVAAETESSPQKEYRSLHFNLDGMENKDIRGEEKKGFPGICASSNPDQLQRHSIVSSASESPVVEMVEIPAQLTPLASSACESPVVVKPSSSADNLTVETPAQLTPQRLLTSCEDKVKTESSQNRTASNHKPTKRSLNFLESEDDTAVLESVPDDSACNKILHDSVPQTFETYTTLPQEVVESVDFESKDNKICQTGLSCPQLSASLPDLVASIHHIFKSVKSSSMTKEELIHKIIMNNFDMTDKSEAEEQIQLLEKLVPDWICRKLAPSGDIFYTIKKVSDLGSIQAKLVRA